jgi:hypothetical protein
MGRFAFNVVIAASVATILTSAPCEAAPAEWSRTYFGEKIRVAARDLQDAKQVLEASDAAEWTDEAVERYLLPALSVVHYGLKMFIDVNGRQPGSADELRSSGCIPSDAWPGNPFNGWQPVGWGSTASEFSPGEMRFQPCPPDWYSGIEAPVAKTYALMINGPASDYLPVNPPSHIFEWVDLPDGVAFVIGARWENTAKQKERKEKAAKAREESPAPSEAEPGAAS